MMAGKSKERTVMSERTSKLRTKEEFAVYLANKQLVLLEYIF